MLKINHSIILFFLVLLITSCKKDTNPIIPNSDTFLYPLEVGNKWEYDRHFATFNYRKKDSIDYPRYDDSIHYYSKIVVEVVGKKTILDSIKASIIQSFETSSSMRSFWSEQYYCNQDNGLFLHGHRFNIGGGNGLPKLINSEKIIFKGKEFNSIDEIIQSLDFILPKAYSICSDSIIYNNPPLMVLAYPIINSGEWIFRQSNEPFAINKRVLGKENITLLSRVFLCHKIEWLYDLNNDNKWDEDISVVDFYADEGLIKRTFFVKDLVITTIASPDSNGYFDSSEEIILTNTNL